MFCDKCGFPLDDKGVCPYCSKGNNTYDNIGMRAQPGGTFGGVAYGMTGSRVTSPASSVLSWIAVALCAYSFINVTSIWSLLSWDLGYSTIWVAILQPALTFAIALPMANQFTRGSAVGSSRQNIFLAISGALCLYSALSGIPVLFSAALSNDMRTYYTMSVIGALLLAGGMLCMILTFRKMKSNESAQKTALTGMGLAGISALLFVFGTVILTGIGGLLRLLATSLSVQVFLLALALLLYVAKYEKEMQTPYSSW